MDLILEELKKCDLESTKGTIPDGVKNAIKEGFDKLVDYFDINSPFAAEEHMGAAAAKAEEKLATREILPSKIAKAKANKARKILIDDSKPVEYQCNRKIAWTAGPAIVVDNADIKSRSASGISSKPSRRSSPEAYKKLKKIKGGKKIPSSDKPARKS